MDANTYPALSARTRRFTLGLPTSFTLSPDGGSVFFLRTRGPEDRVSCLWRLDSTGEHLLVAPEDLGAGGEIPEAERIRRERARQRTSGIVGYSTDKAVRTAALAVDGQLWTVDLTTGDTRPVQTAGPVVDPRLDPTGQRVAYVTGSDVYVVELASGVQLCSVAADGPDVTWGLAEHVASESMGRYRGHWWSPDGTQLLVTRVDSSRILTWWIADPSNPDREPRAIRYPAAGSANALVSLHVLQLDGSTTEITWDHKAFEYLCAVSWDEHGPLLSVQSRDQRHLLVLDGTNEVLHEQRDKAWVELIPGTPARTTSGKLVHTRDTPGTRHLTVGGEVVTPEGIQVTAVLAVDGETVLFEATSEPTENHLWLLDDGLRQLTKTPGSHTGTRSGDALLLQSNTESGRSYVLSRPGQPDLRIESLAAELPIQPRITWYKAGQQELRSALLLPSWYEAGTRLPVLMAPYGGAALRLVVRMTAAWFGTAQWYAENGFAVVISDGRGTPGRGPAWEKMVHLDTMTAPVEDQVTALRAAAELCPDLDLTRVGIMGWSAGGTLAAMSVLRRPDVFHAAAAGAPVTDMRLYDTHWRERFLGHPKDNPEAYDRSSPISEAARLERPLLLVHGIADDNVVVAHTLRMSAALLAAGRPHQVLPLSGATHSPSDPATATGLMKHQLQFFKTVLRPA